jgi:membrane fusion protein, heavy metal efflux system
MMANPQLHLFVKRLRSTLGPDAGGITDTQLLERFVSNRDEAAFEVLVWRHGPMVLGVCDRLVQHDQDAEDVFQATFLALARKAASVGKREALGGWLHTTAYRTALRVRLRAVQRARLQELPADVPAAQTNNEVWRDLRPVLDEEIGRLPLKYRLPVILCYLQGKTTEEVAQQLGCARGTVCSRLSWARERLHSRLTRRGMALAAVALTAALSRGPAMAASTGLVQTTVKGALAFAAGQTVAASSTQALLLAEGILKAMFMTKVKLAVVVLLTLGLAAVGAGVFTQGVRADKPDLAGPELVAGNADALRVPAERLAPLGIRIADIRQREAQPRILRVVGSTALDPDRMVRVRSRVSGEVVEIGKVAEAGVEQLIRAGARVRKGQLLAVVWSKDVGEKKGELIDALLRLRPEQEILTRIEEAYKQGAITEVALIQARRNVEADRNAVVRAERTLQIWRLADEEVKAVKEEAEQIARRLGKRDPDKEKNWARVEIRAPQDGTVVEKNITVGEYLVDGTNTLFVIANLERLCVLANIPEADLSDLLSLPAVSRKWTVQVGDLPAVEGKIDEVGYIIDPNQHTAVAKGLIDNPEQKLRAGQFLTAAISLPPAPRDVIIPASAVVEAGGACFVFIQPDPKQFVYQQRRVLIVRRGNDVVHVRSPLSPKEERQSFQPLRLGERIVTSGAIDLKAALDDLKSKQKQ